MDRQSGLQSSSVTVMNGQRRRTIRRPSGLDGDYVSRREAAALLGFASEFKVRQLEKQGFLHPARGIMDSAWYPRSKVMALRRARDAQAGAGFRGAVGAPTNGRWSDAALIGHLRATAATNGDSGYRVLTVVDLVAETGVGIARAEKVYRFWLAHDNHPLAVAARSTRLGAGRAVRPLPFSSAATETPPTEGRVSVDIQPGERRRGERLERDTLILHLRDPDPAVRALAFQRHKDKQKR